MTPEDILTRVGDQLGIRRVFGRPIDRDGFTVVPVAVSIGGGGGGNAPEDQGSGGGFGGMVRGIGAYSISNGKSALSSPWTPRPSRRYSSSPSASLSARDDGEGPDQGARRPEPLGFGKAVAFRPASFAARSGR